MTRARAIEIDVIVEGGDWPADVDSVVRRAIEAAAHTRKAAKGTVSVLLTNDATIRKLNATWRALDKPTNVLSFPAPANNSANALGDIAIACETTAREAREEAKPFAHHLMHLAVHGFLHLLGHDHENDRDADAMERLERDILAELGVCDPYLIRDDARV